MGPWVRWIIFKPYQQQQHQLFLPPSTGLVTGLGIECGLWLGFTQAPITPFLK